MVVVNEVLVPVELLIAPGRDVLGERSVRKEKLGLLCLLFFATITHIRCLAVMVEI